MSRDLNLDFGEEDCGEALADGTEDFKRTTDSLLGEQEPRYFKFRGWDSADGPRVYEGEFEKGEVYRGFEHPGDSDEEEAILLLEDHEFNIGLATAGHCLPTAEELLEYFESDHDGDRETDLVTVQFGGEEYEIEPEDIALTNHFEEEVVREEDDDQLVEEYAHWFGEVTAEEWLKSLVGRMRWTTSK